MQWTTGWSKQTLYGTSYRLWNAPTHLQNIREHVSNRKFKKCLKIRKFLKIVKNVERSALRPLTTILNALQHTMPKLF